MSTTTGSAVLTASEQRRFRRAIRSLNDLIEEVRQRLPEAGYYLANDTLHLMSGSSHDERSAHSRQDRILINERLRFSGGGDW